MTQTERQKLGQWGEEMASLFLIKAGYKIISRNFIDKHCEIDIIAEACDWQKKKVLCFIEVKTREYDDGSAERAVDIEKQKRLLSAAKIYCLNNSIDIERTPIQFEQVSVVGRLNDLAPVVRKNVLPVE